MIKEVVRSRHGLALTVLLLLFSACSGPDDTARVVGLWGMGHIKSNGMNVSDGKEWFDFHADGMVDTRSSPFTYQRGYWRVDQDAHTFTLGEEGLDSLVYQYEFVGEDSLYLATTMPQNNHKIAICMVRIAKKPIEMEDEMGGVPKLLPPDAPPPLPDSAQ
jgi:hypothetical protein